jgi:hypothetical protein
MVNCLLLISIHVAHPFVYLDCGPPEELVKMMAIFAICMLILSSIGYCLNSLS